MTSISPANGSRLRVRTVCAAALLALCGACGGGSGGGGAGSGSGTLPAPPVRTPGITVLAGDPAVSGSIDGKGAAARFNSPGAIVIDAAGNLYVADTFNYTIRKIAPDGQVSTIAGKPGVSGFQDGKAADALFGRIAALAIDGAGKLYAGDALNVRKITPGGDVASIYKIAYGSSPDSRSVALFYASGIAVDNAGSLYITNGIGTRRVSAGNTLTMLEGVATMDNVFGTRSTIPRGIALDGNGNLYLADLRNTISRANAGATTLTTFVGTPDQTGNSDGSGANARFNRVVSLSADGNGNVYAVDQLNKLIRKITPNAVVSTVAGIPGATSLQTGALPGSFGGLDAVVADGNGNLYATTGHAVVKITLP